MSFLSQGGSLLWSTLLNDQTGIQIWAGETKKERGELTMPIKMISQDSGSQALASVCALNAIYWRALESVITIISSDHCVVPAHSIPCPRSTATSWRNPRRLFQGLLFLFKKCNNVQKWSKSVLNFTFASFDRAVEECKITMTTGPSRYVQVSTVRLRYKITSQWGSLDGSSRPKRSTRESPDGPYC